MESDRYPDGVLTVGSMEQEVQDAVLAERERCAKIAEDNATGEGYAIAAAIRSGK